MGDKPTHAEVEPLLWQDARETRSYTLSNIFDNGRTKYSTHINEWLMYTSGYSKMHLTAIIVIVCLNVGYLG